MLTIDAINEMIGYVGESPVDSADPDYTSHPLYESALRILTATGRTIQSKGWWFNTRPTTLTPVSGTVTIPATTIAVAVQPLYREQYTIRDGKLYDLTNGSFTIATPLKAAIRELVPFEDLPESAADYIKEQAAVRFVQTYDGDRSKLAEVKENAKLAYIVFNTEHIRNLKVNLFNTQSMGPVLSNVWYTRYYIR